MFGESRPMAADVLTFMPSRSCSREPLGMRVDVLGRDPQLLRRVDRQPEAVVAVARAALPSRGELREGRRLVVAAVGEALDRLVGEDVVAAVDPVRERAPPRGSRGRRRRRRARRDRTATSAARRSIVASPPACSCRASSAAKSTSTSSSPFSAKTSPRLSALRAANLIPPPRPRRSGSSATTISAPRPASSRSKSSPCPAAHETITRLDARRARAARPGSAASGVPATSTSAFGRPPAASPSRSALPPARMIASTSRSRPDWEFGRSSRAARRSGTSGGRCLRRRSRRGASPPGSSRLRPSMISGFAIAARVSSRGEALAARPIR